MRKTIRPTRCRVSSFLTCEPKQGDFYSAGSISLLLRNLSQVLKLKNMNEKRFVDHDTSVEDYVESLENRNTKEKTKRDVKLLETFLRNEKNDEREVQDIEPAELNKHLAEFIRSVRRKDGEDYEPSSLRCLVSSIERHLKKNNYTKSIINDKEFELFRKCLRAKQKRAEESRPRQQGQSCLGNHGRGSRYTLRKQFAWSFLC